MKSQKSDSNVGVKSESEKHIVSCQLSVVSCQLSVVSCPLLVVLFAKKFKIKSAFLGRQTTCGTCDRRFTLGSQSDITSPSDTVLTVAEKGERTVTVRSDGSLNAGDVVCSLKSGARNFISTWHAAGIS